MKRTFRIYILSAMHAKAQFVGEEEAEGPREIVEQLAEDLSRSTGGSNLTLAIYDLDDGQLYVWQLARSAFEITAGLD